VLNLTCLLNTSLGLTIPYSYIPNTLDIFQNMLLYYCSSTIFLKASAKGKVTIVSREGDTTLALVKWLSQGLF
jgi:hypothetical protein